MSFSNPIQYGLIMALKSLFSEILKMAKCHLLFLLIRKNTLSIKSSHCAGQGRSTLTLSEIITHNSHYPQGIHNMTFGQNASQQSSSNFDIILYGGNSSRHLCVQSPPLKVLLRVTHYHTLSLWKQFMSSLHPVPKNSSHPFCVQFPTLPLGEIAHAIFASSTQPQGLADCLALTQPLKSYFIALFQLLALLKFCFRTKQPITLQMVYGSFVFSFKKLL